MQQISPSKVFIRPLVLFILFGIIAIILFRTQGIFFFVFIFTPITSVVNQMFTKYKIEGNKLIINELFAKNEYNVDNIRFVKFTKANAIQKYVFGFPDQFQMLGYNTYDDRPIFPKKDLVFNAESKQLYFKN